MQARREPLYQRRALKEGGEGGRANEHHHVSSKIKNRKKKEIHEARGKGLGIEYYCGGRGGDLRKRAYVSAPSRKKNAYEERKEKSSFLTPWGTDPRKRKSCTKKKELPMHNPYQDIKNRLRVGKKGDLGDRAGENVDRGGMEEGIGKRKENISARTPYHPKALYRGRNCVTNGEKGEEVHGEDKRRRST